MMIESWTKLIVVVMVVAGTIFLTYVGKLDTQATTALLGAALGYVFGNAHGIISAQRTFKAQTTHKEN